MIPWGASEGQFGDPLEPLRGSSGIPCSSKPSALTSPLSSEVRFKLFFVVYIRDEPPFFSRVNR